MKNHLGLLSGLLIAQLLLIAAIFVFDQPAEQGSGLLDLDAAQVTGFTITDMEGASIELRRTENGWELPGGVAADESRILAVLERLAAMHSLWPVAATESSQSRFEVAEDSFQRRLELTGEGIDSVIYLGSSPGYRRVHARNRDADDVFSIEFSDYEVPTDASEWLDKAQLQTRGVTRVALKDGWTLTANESADGDDGWQVDGGPADAKTASALVKRLEEIRLLGVFSGDPQTLEAARVFEITDAVGTCTLTVQHEPAEDVYVVTSSRVPGSFTVASYIIEQILVDAATLQRRVDVKLSAPAPLLPADEMEAEAETSPLNQ